MFTALSLFHRRFAEAVFSGVPERERVCVLAGVLWLGCKVADEPRQLRDILREAGVSGDACAAASSSAASTAAAAAAADAERLALEAADFDALDGWCGCVGAFLGHVSECLCVECLAELRGLEAFALACCATLSDCFLFPFCVEVDPAVLAYAIVHLNLAAEATPSGSARARLFPSDSAVAFYGAKFRGFLKRRFCADECGSGEGSCGESGNGDGNGNGSSGGGGGGVCVVMSVAAKVGWHLAEFAGASVFRCVLPSLWEYLAVDADVHRVQSGV